MSAEPDATSAGPRHLQAVPPATGVPRTPPTPRHMQPIANRGIHDHEWTLREVINSETGAPSSWFECRSCGLPYA